MNRAQVTKMMTKVCSNCTEGTINVYVRNLFRLAKLAGLDTIPKKSGWLNKKPLVAKFKKEPLKVRRMLAVAAVKATKMYGDENSGGWGQMMADSTDEYEKNRDSRQKTKRYVETRQCTLGVRQTGCEGQGR